MCNAFLVAKLMYFSKCSTVLVVDLLRFTGDICLFCLAFHVGAHEERRHIYPIRSRETTEHCFIDCSDAFLFWDVLQRTIKKYLLINSHSICYLPVPVGEHVPYYLFVLLSLYSLENTKPAVFEADIQTNIHVARSVIDFISDSADQIALV